MVQWLHLLLWYVLMNDAARRWAVARTLFPLLGGIVHMGKELGENGELELNCQWAWLRLMCIRWILKIYNHTRKNGGVSRIMSLFWEGCLIYHHLAEGDRLVE